MGSVNNFDSILVIGHRNPDTDAIASAVGYAWLLDSLGSQRYIAGRAGKVNAQTTFVLERFGIEAPMLVTDIYSRVQDLAESIPSLHQGQTLLDACRSVAKTRRPAPVLDNGGKPVGLLSGAGLFANLAEALSSASVLALARELERPAVTGIDTETTVLIADEHVRDVLGQVLRTEQDDFLVVDEAGRYVGLCRKSALLAPPRRKLVMVDHNELGQAVPGLEEAELVEVLDHHRLGNLPTAVPIRFQVDPVGSCSTLVAERGFDAQKTFPAPIAGMLLSGILSDTLVFRSPTTTARDRAAALRLVGMAGLAPADANDDKRMEAINTFGQELLAAGAGLGTRSAEEVINTDLKFYETSGLASAIAQVEVANFSELAPRLTELHDALKQLAESHKLALALLMVTDVVRGNSRLVVAGEARIVSALPYARLDDDTLDAPGVVSRKKQLLPTVLAVLSQSV